jgi:hypothetical protein
MQATRNPMLPSNDLVRPFRFHLPHSPETLQGPWRCSR